MSDAARRARHGLRDGPGRPHRGDGVRHRSSPKGTPAEVQAQPGGAGGVPGRASNERRDRRDDADLLLEVTRPARRLRQGRGACTTA
ncbi:MAG: hypothetical protein MZV49_09560 [Rhodopseudomonas palustris]|nr:hypothetical protein [Rhodopseudomonas palustris]